MQEVSTMADDFYKLYCEEVEKNEKLVKENKYLKGRVRSLSSQLDYLMENQDKIIERKVNKQVDKITDAFENKITTFTPTRVSPFSSLTVPETVISF